MKRKFRVSFLCLLLACLCLIPFSVPMMAEEITGDGSIVSQPINWFKEQGLTSGAATVHGNNQTRIAKTSTGVYITCPLEETTAVNPHENVKMDACYYGIFRIKNDGTFELLAKDVMFFLAAGATTNIMVDENEDVWVVTGWNEGSSFYTMVVWKYDTKTDTSEKWTQTCYYQKGQNFGKAYSMIDVANHKIYHVALGGNIPGFMIWNTFNMDTKQWNKKMNYYRSNETCFYHFGYATGKGGFFMATTRSVDNLGVFSNIEGMRVSEAMSKYRNRPAIDVNQVWDQTHILYVPNADENVVYDMALSEALYDVERGVYPTMNTTQSDCYYDWDTGYFYVIVTSNDANGIGKKCILYVLDTKHFEANTEEELFFPIISKKELVFAYGPGLSYIPKMVRDAEGTYYLVVADERVSDFEIWRSTNDLNTEYEYIYHFALDEYYNKKTYSEWNSFISATNRNNCAQSSDVSAFIYNGSICWQYFTIDFAALRAYLASK